MHTLFCGTGVGLFFSGFSLCAPWEQDKKGRQGRVCFLVPLRQLLSPGLPLEGGPFGPGVLAVEDPMAGVDLAREAVCSPVPVSACLQRHWREWMEVGVIQRAHEDVSEEDMCLFRVKAHEVRGVATSAMFKKIRSTGDLRDSTVRSSNYR
ncbi:hypothetical protein E2C01_045121 [Portunus trituberculatus]|uniref:Uncharacterized protein n=1 Tax=Portunus trituberculatus TaxID=210409 RepID=A0A5B7G148_PORTR|nr:hypothetical protein [Portunus trituberculatus]